MKHVLSKALPRQAAQRNKVQGPKKINTGTRGGNVVGQRPDGTPIYASERKKGAKVPAKDTGAKEKLAALEKRVAALKTKGVNTGKVEALIATIKAKL